MESRCAPNCWARNSWCFATPMVALACWMSTARTAARRWFMVATKKAAFAACITAGNSTSMARCWRCLPSRRPANLQRGPGTKPMRRTRAAAMSGPTWAPPPKCPISRCRPGRPPLTRASASSKCTPRPTGRRRSRAASIQPTARTCTPRIFRRRASMVAPRPPPASGRAPPPTRRRAFRRKPHPTASAMPPYAGPSRTRQRRTMCASPNSSRPSRH